jgi:hypothetical protein
LSYFLTIILESTISPRCSGSFNRIKVFEAKRCVHREEMHLEAGQWQCSLADPRTPPYG